MYFRVLGENAANLNQLIRDAGGTNTSAKIRIRGINSGFFEGPMKQELQEPLQFNVSAQSETLLAELVTRLKASIQSAMGEI